MNAWVRRILTKPLWLWETKRYYGMREKVFCLPPLGVRSNGGVPTLAVLTTPKTINNAAWALYSIARQLESEVSMEMVVDGQIGKHRVLEICRLLPGILISSVRDHVDRLAPSAPALFRLAKTHPMAGKMAAILNLQRRAHLLFSDDDVLAFRPLNDVDRCIVAGVPHALYLREQSGGKVQEEPSIRVGLEKLGLPWLHDINVGFILIPKDSLDIAMCDRILEESPPVETWFPDTMILAALLRQKAAQVLPDSYVVSTQRQFFYEADVDYTKVVLRHFVTPVRHLMYAKGMPRIWRCAERKRATRIEPNR